VRTYAARFESQGPSVAVARHAVVDFARACGFVGDTLCDIECAVGEALANAVEHGHCDGATIEVSCAFRDARLTVEIKDPGPGFDRKRGFGMPAVRGPFWRGYGIHIIKTLMDDVTYLERGTRVRLVKRLQTG
jgi:anti-sigma regulatory factor (Ser/Thr protein kinase)